MKAQRAARLDMPLIHSQRNANKHYRQLHQAGNEAAWWEKLRINALEIARGLWVQTQTIKTSDVIGTARKMIDPKNFEKISDGLKKLADVKLPQSIFKQFASDLQLKDLLAKVEAIVAKANLTFAKTVSKDTLPTETLPNNTLSNEPPSEKASLKKTPPKEARSKKTVSKKTPSKKKTKRPLKRRARALS